MAVLTARRRCSTGSSNLYDTSKSATNGGGNFRANFGVERDGVNLLAEAGLYSKGAEITTEAEFDSYS